jgi:hypothetical protein
MWKHLRLALFSSPVASRPAWHFLLCMIFVVLWILLLQLIFELKLCRQSMWCFGLSDHMCCILLCSHQTLVPKKHSAIGFAFHYLILVIFGPLHSYTKTENVLHILKMHVLKIQRFKHCSMPEMFALFSSKMESQQLFHQLPPYHKVGLFQMSLHPMSYPIKWKFEPDDRPIFGDQILNSALSLKWNSIDIFSESKNRCTSHQHNARNKELSNWPPYHSYICRQGQSVAVFSKTMSHNKASPGKRGIAVVH